MFFNIKKYNGGRMGGIIKGVSVKGNLGHILRIPQGKPQKKFETKKLFELKKNFPLSPSWGEGGRS